MRCKEMKFGDYLREHQTFNPQNQTLKQIILYNSSQVDGFEFSHISFALLSEIFSFYSRLWKSVNVSNYDPKLCS